MPVIVQKYGGSSVSDADKIEKIAALISAVKMEGNDEHELADETYEWVNPKLVVSAAAAVFDRKNDLWKLAVKNLHD